MTGQKESGKREAALGFKRSQLLYDIKNLGFIEGDVLEPEQYHTRQRIQDIGERGNVDRVTRIMDLSVAHCTEKLYPFTRREIRRAPTVIDDRLREDKIYWIVLRVAADFSETTLIYLEKLIHEFIVSRVLYDWLSITNPSKREIWREKMEELEAEIMKSLKKRQGRVRRGLHPF
ncbi:MAG: hypothetical protein J1D77_03690 [Muribaculaceae bacterium]|nr:hypothetical protein [Muribaculaceae bacterium]